MPTWLKIILIIFAAGALLVVAAIVAGAWWIKSHEKDLRASAEKVTNEACEFGKGKDGEACLVEGFARLDRCGGNFICQAKSQVFVQTCLESATVPADFCTNVPKSRDFLGTAKWSISECIHRGRANDQRCTQMVQSIQRYCDQHQ